MTKETVQLALALWAGKNPTISDAQTSMIQACPGVVAVYPKVQAVAPCSPLTSPPLLTSPLTSPLPPLTSPPSPHLSPPRPSSSPLSPPFSSGERIRRHMCSRQTQAPSGLSS